MHPISKKDHRAGFTLVEVVLALGVVAIAIPSIIGLLGVVSNVSKVTMDRGDAASAVNSFQLYLGGNVRDPGTNETVPFATVYGWVSAAGEDPVAAQVLYAYKATANPNGYIVSQYPPAVNFDGRILVAEILAPGTSLLPAAALAGDVSAYPKAYLPLNLSMHALSFAGEERRPPNFVDSYPMTISR